MDNIAGPVALIGFIALGVALFWSRHLLYRNRPAASDDAMKLNLSIIGWLCDLSRSS